MLVHENMTSESINMKKHDYYVNRIQFSREVTGGGTGPVWTWKVKSWQSPGTQLGIKLS